MFTRIHRRVIIKHFGSTRNFVIWTAAVIFTIYVIDSFILTRDRLENIVNGPRNVEQMNQVKKDNVQQEPKAQEKSAAKEQEKPQEKKIEEKPPDSEPKCGLQEGCPAGKYAYNVISGQGKDGSPTICFNGEYGVSPSKANGHRGMNIVVVNEKTMKIEETRYFDTYEEDTALARYLKLGIKENGILLVASMDEASNNLKDESKSWFHQFGSGMIDKVKFRDAFVMAGQRGLSRGSAIEKLGSRENKEFADVIEISGCMSIPVGKLGEVNVQAPAAEHNGPDNSNIKTGEEQPNCGVKDGCGSESFPVHLYTGKANSEAPKICVNGKYVVAKGLNDGGRGFNIVIVDPKTKDIIRVGHFDTYAEDSSNLEIFLEMMNPGEIVVAVTHDDASKNFNEHGRKLFEEAGSSLIRELKFRDVWAFVGQKGISGHSAIEDIEFAGPNGAWPRTISKRVCVSAKMKGSQIKPDPLANKNEKRRKFCAKYDGYSDFCDAEHIDEPLVPAPLTNKALENHAIFNVPIVVVPGLNMNAVRMQLETLLMNPGIKPNMVTAMYDENFDEPAALVELFEFKSAKLSRSTKYVYQMDKALTKVWEMYPDAKHVIVLEEEVIVGPDFLNFLAQCLDVVEKDNTLVGVSTWNDNGYEGVSELTDIAYRTETLPGLGFLLKKSFYDSHMKNSMEECCMHRSWDGWFNGKLGGKEMIVPDVSRVYRRPYEGLSQQADLLAALFNRKRVTNLESSPEIKNINELTADAYESHVNALVGSSKPLDTTNVKDCLSGAGLGFYIPETSGQTYSIFFKQDNLGDHSVLSHLCKCFKLFHLENYKARGLHKGLLRFSYKGNNMLLVGSGSPYYKHMPSSYIPVALS